MRRARSLYHLASQGWTCISANYYLARSPADAFPRNLIDVKKVIAWGPHPRQRVRRRSRHDLPGRCVGRCPPHGDRGTQRQRIRRSSRASRTPIRRSRPASDCTATTGPSVETNTFRRPRHSSTEATLHRSSSSMAIRTPTPSSKAPERSSSTSVRFHPTRSCTPNFPAPSTRSTCSTRCASRPSSTRSKRSPRGCAVNGGRTADRTGSLRCLRSALRRARAAHLIECCG